MESSENRLGKNSVRVEVQIDLERQRKELTMLHNFQYADATKRARLNLIIGFLSSVAGFTMVNQSNAPFSSGHLILAGGCYFIFAPINLFSDIKRLRENFIKIEIERLRKNLEKDDVIIYEFSEVGFSYKDSDLETKVKWSYYKEFVVQEEYLFLKHLSGAVQSVSKVDLGADNFEKAVEIVKQHVKSAVGKKQNENSGSEDLLDEDVKN